MVNSYLTVLTADLHSLMFWNVRMHQVHLGLRHSLMKDLQNMQVRKVLKPTLLSLCL